MSKNRKSPTALARVCLGLLLLLPVAGAAWAQKMPDFSGEWKQDNARCQPKRNGDVTLRVVHRDPELLVETTIVRNAASPRHALQKYTTDGKMSVSTGADGDEFHIAIVWSDSSLVFSIEEHEDGRVLQSKETWSVLEDGATLQRTRDLPNGDRQILVYRHQQRSLN